MKPIVSRCAIPGCHAGAQDPNLSDYTKLLDKYKQKPGAQNILVIHGIATNNMHSGMAWLSGSDQSAIAGWINSLP